MQQFCSWETDRSLRGQHETEQEKIEKRSKEIFLYKVTDEWNKLREDEVNIENIK